MERNRPDMADVGAFMKVARAGGFREAARASDISASALSDAVRRLEAELGVRLFNRTTRSVVPTEAGRGLMERIGPAFGEINAALDFTRGFRDRPVGVLRLNVPVSAARLVLPPIVPPFLAAYPDIRMEIMTDESFVDVIAAGCDAGIRYDERLQQDMIAVPIGPRIQRYASGASPAYLDTHGRPQHPRDLLAHSCIRGRFAGRPISPWSSNATARRSRSTRPRRLWCRRAAGRISASQRRLPEPASSRYSRTGCVRTSKPER